jgi:hypothetical protein
MSASRESIEAEADRLRRRGELGQALELYHTLLANSPEDAGLRDKVDQVGELLQPMELNHPKAAHGTTAPSSLEERAERAAAHGDYAEAAALYRRALQEAPESELLAERLAEVFALAKRGSAPAAAAPATPEALLQGLLERIAQRRDRRG